MKSTKPRSPSRPAAQRSARLAKTSASGQIVGFNYASLDPDIAKEVKDHTNIIKGILKGGGLAIGKRLLKVRDRLDHGQFLAWLHAEFGMSIRTAQRYMLAASCVAKYDRLSHLPISAIYVLSAKATPEKARDNVIARLNNGVKPKLINVAEIVRAYTKKAGTPAAKMGKRSATASPAQRTATVRTSPTKAGAPVTAPSSNPDAPSIDGPIGGDEPRVRCTPKVWDKIQNRGPRAGKRRSYRAVIFNDDGIPVIRSLTRIRPQADVK